MCILDELGRGTSTFDGTAIAHAVVDFIAGRVRCRTLFATHYHSLVEDWSVDPRVKLGHMDCLVQQASDNTASNAVEEKDAAERVTFLYHLCDGSSPKSYGVNVARLAGLPMEVLQLASRQSEAFLMVANKARNGTGASNTDDATARIERAVMYQRYFDRLVSLMRSADVTTESSRLIPLVAELWNRFKHETTTAH